MSPTARSKQHLEQLGYRVAIVEKVVPHTYFKQDLFGVIDMLAMRPGEPLLAVQTTTTDHLCARMAKDPATVQQWLSTGNRFAFHGWAIRGAAGTRKRWTLDHREMTGK